MKASVEVAVALLFVASALVPVSASVRPKEMEVLPLGAVRADGWLRTQLDKQRDGLTGHAERLYPDIGQSDWLTGGKRGGQFDWERGPYYAKGLVSLALVLRDDKLTAKAKRWVDAVLASQREDGDFGPKRNNWWANMIVLHYVRDWAEATGDKRVVPFLERYFNYQLANLANHGLLADSAWAMCRAGDEIDVVLWVWERTRDESVLRLARLLAEQSADWTEYYWNGGDGQWKFGYRAHIVNFQQGLKLPMLRWRLGGSEKDRDAYLAACSEDGWAMKMNGRVDRMVNGTEPLSGRSASEGTELCAIAERILSCQNVIEGTGMVCPADDLEIVAYNTLPACLADDGKGVRYYQVLNQPMCVNGKGHGYSCWGEGAATVPGPDAGYGCCRSNFHFAWPKFVQSMWMRKGLGLVAVAYGPCRLDCDVASIVETGGYPFGDRVTLTFERTKGDRWPLYVRVPGWARRTTVAVNGDCVAGASAGKFLCIDRAWRAGDCVELRFEPDVLAIEGVNGSVAVRRGPLVYALAMDAEVRNLPVATNRIGFAAREYRGKSAWNFALVKKALGDARPTFANCGKDPFVHGARPATLEIKAMSTDFAGWGTMSTAWPLRPVEPPPSPVRRALGEEVYVKFVPLGSTQVRMTLFPWVE